MSAGSEMKADTEGSGTYLSFVGRNGIESNSCEFTDKATETDEQREESQ